MTHEEAKLTIEYLKKMQEKYIEGEGYERHPLPEWYALDKAIETIEQTTWIPVSEKLPEEGCCILTTINGIRGIKIRSGYYSDNIFNNDNGNIWKPTDKEILAWMPSPEPYRKDGE